MKILDDVIKDLEKCMTDDAIESEGFYLATDSLHYLKKYRDTKNILDVERKETIEAYRQWQDAKEKLEAQTNQKMWVDNHFQFEISDNPPLTWDELKFMKGKPIWVEDNLETPEDITKYWAIMRRIEKTESDEYVLLSDFYYGKSQYGKDWVIYRKERK